MTVNLPDFKDTLCQHLTVCGQVSLKSAGQRALLKKEQQLIATYRPSAGRTFARLISGNSTHLHVDCTLREVMGSKPPKTTARIADLKQAIVEFAGCGIDLGITAHFDYPIEMFHPRSLIGSITKKSGSGGVSISLTEGTLELEGSPLTSLSWDVGDSRDSIEITLQAERETTVSNDYIVESFSWIRNWASSITEDARP